METRTYGPVTEAQATQFLHEAKTNGLTVTPATAYSGVVTGYGAEISYRYDTAQQSLQLSLVKHPPLLGGVVWGQVEQRIPPGVSRQV